MTEPEAGEPIASDFHVKLGRGGARRPEQLMVVVGTLLFIAMVKPWGEPAPAAVGPVRPAHTVAPTEPGPSVDVLCTGGQWLIEAAERWAGSFARTWVFTEAVEARSPTDPAIGFVTVVAQQIIAIGYCPSFWDDSRPHRALTIYRLERNGDAVVVPTVPVRLAQKAGAAANVLFQPVHGEDTGFGPLWAAGRYVMHISGPGDYERWLGFDIRLVPVAGLLTMPPPTPAIAPGAPAGASAAP